MNLKKQTPPIKRDIPQSKKRSFWIILLSLPIVFFLLLEMMLRLFDYGGNPDLVVKTNVAGKEYYTLNRQVAKRYFTQKGVAIPEAFDDLFEIKKQPNTKRVFMLGESTMAGFPFDYNATAPRLLQDRLRKAFPEMNIEVVNVGLAAVNSYTVLDLIRELVNYEPDAFVLYLGHNEFYGAFGVGSTEYLGQWRSLVNLYLKLQRVRTFVLIRNGMSEIAGLFHKAHTIHDATLMEAMVREQTIPYHSDEYNIARNNYRANLEDIISIAQENGTPIVISTLASNLRDQKPLLPVFTPGADQQKWQALVDNGMMLMRERKFEEALQAFTQAQQIDSGNAEGYFFAANCNDSLGRYDEAYRMYSTARDYDGMRFRASEEFNELIRGIAKENNAPLADAERAFEDASPYRLVGTYLMIEHLHPNFDGYFLLAKVFYDAIRAHHLLVDSIRWATVEQINDKELKQISGVTDFTIESANIRIHGLVNRWPFKPAGTVAPKFVTSDYIQEVANDYVNKRIAWSSAHMKIAEWYKSRDEYEKAFGEYFAISKVAWYSYQPLMEMGDVERLMERPHAAESLYLKAAALDPNPFVHVRLGMLYYDMNNLQKSIDAFEEAFRVEVSAREGFKTSDRSMVRYFLAVAYGKQGNIPKAKSNLELAVQIDPKNQEAQALLSKLR